MNEQIEYDVGDQIRWIIKLAEKNEGVRYNKLVTMEGHTLSFDLSEDDGLAYSMVLEMIEVYNKYRGG